MLDVTAGRVLGQQAPDDDVLKTALVNIGQQAELMGRVRMGLLSMDRILVYHAASSAQRPETTSGTRSLRAATQRDIQALEVHADFLTSRIGMTIDATMGMIGLQQNERVRILSVMTALFLPPTLIASFYGMNFDVFPTTHGPMGIPMAIGLMITSVVATVALLKLKNWL